MELLCQAMFKDSSLPCEEFRYRCESNSIPLVELGGVTEAPGPQGSTEYCMYIDYMVCVIYKIKSCLRQGSTNIWAYFPGHLRVLLSENFK